jgi:H+/Cl- antiporter ClcA
MYRRLRHTQRRLLSLRHWRIRLVFWLGALLLGAFAAGFALIATFADKSFHRLVEALPYAALLLPPAGLVAVAWLTKRYFPNADGSGIPQAIAALKIKHEHQRSKLLSLRIAFGKILLTTLGLSCGASIGREGPTVHIGVAIMTSLGKLARFPPQVLERGLILAGGAGGIAAAFNTPLAGILFAVEEMSRSFDERSNGTILVTVLLAGITALSILGNYTYFGTTNASLVFSADWLAVPTCGVIGGLLGGMFSALLIYGARRIAPFARRRPLALAAMCGAGISLLGLLSGGLTYGTGYQEAHGVVTGTDTLPVAYFFMKMLATLVSYLSGIPGGIFAPSLASGAALGADLAAWFPSTPAEAIVILGMVAYFTGVVQTPITAFVIIMEMTQNQAMLLPLIATALIAYSVSKIVCPEAIYRALAKNYLGHETPPPETPPPPPPAAEPPRAP